MPDILLVDDDPEQLSLRRMVLEDKGHTVRCAETAARALQLIGHRLPSCVVMDLCLPESAQGRTLIEDLKRRWPDLPVVVLTGSPHELDSITETPLIAALLRKPVRSERLLAVISKLALALLLYVAPVVAQSKPHESSFEVTWADAEQIAQISMAALGADWAQSGREGALAAISVDGGEPHHAWVFGENSRPVGIFLGRLSAGRHTIKVSRDRRSSPAVGLRVTNVRITPIPPASQQAAAFVYAPVLFARTNTLGRFSDVPLLTYVTESREGGLRVLEYTVIFSNEDGGTSSRNLMARWGRVTDIEYVYRVWIDEQGKRLKTLIQTRDHKDVPYEGEHFHDHPMLQPVTDNNMVEPARHDASPLRFQLCPQPADLRNGSRELVMDGEPWTYVMARKEMERENKLRKPMEIDGEMIADPRNYLSVEVEIELKDAVIQAYAVTPGGKQMYGSASGRTAGYVDRNGWVRVAIEMPPGQSRKGIDAIGFDCITKVDQRTKSFPATGSCTVKRVGKVFFPDAEGKPGPLIQVPGSATLPTGQLVLLPVQR